MQPDDKIAEPASACQPQWIAHNRFLFYCAKAAGAPVAAGDGPAPQPAPCNHGHCLFKQRG